MTSDSVRAWRFPLLAVLVSACTFELAPLVTDDPSLGGAAGGGFGGGAGSGGVNVGGVAGGGAPGGGAQAGGGAGGVGATGGDASLGGSGGGPPQEGPLVGDFALGFYYITAEDDFSGTKSTNLYDASCVLITSVSASFATSLAQLGTGKLSNGTVLSYAGPCACPTSPCYIVADAQHPWGYGVQNKALVPFRTIAVDKNEIAYGKRLYVPGFDGITVPGSPPWGGFVHDGCVSADDAGGTLAGKDLSWFVALKPYYQSLDAQITLTSVLVYEGGTRCP